MIDLQKNRRYDLNSERPNIDFTGDPGLTKQEPAEDADINVLMRRFGVTDHSTLPNFTAPDALYADLTEYPDDPVAIAEVIRRANNTFLQMPADLRARFRDAAGLHSFLQDSKNWDEAVTLGLLARAAAKPVQAPVSPSTGSVKEPPVPNA